MPPEVWGSYLERNIRFSLRPAARVGPSLNLGRCPGFAPNRPSGYPPCRGDGRPDHRCHSKIRSPVRAPLNTRLSIINCGIGAYKVCARCGFARGQSPGRRVTQCACADAHRHRMFRFRACYGGGTPP